MMDRQVIFDRWWGRGVAAFTLLFLGWFIFSELEGLITFGQLLVDSIVIIPDSIQVIVGYYTGVAIVPFMTSLLVGAIFGGVMTGWLNRSSLPVFWGVLAGATVGAVGSQILIYPMQHCTYLPDTDALRQVIGWGVTIVSSLLFLAPLWTFVQRRNRLFETGTSGYFKGWAVPLMFLAPSLISLVVFLYYPAIQVATLSLNAQRFRQTRFVCLDNYVDLLSNTIYQNSFLTTLSLTIAIVFLTMALGLMIALLAAQKVRGASIYRTLLIWPYALSPVVTGAIFLAMFRQGRSGLINHLLYEMFGITPQWFTNPSLALWVIILASVWNALGFNILFYVAGLQNIPKDLLEAAEIDGANRLQRFMSITFPLLSPFSFFLLVTNVTYSFYGIYGAVDTLTQGGPPLGVGGAEGGATNVLIYKLYEDAFAPGGQIGDAAAQSIILFLLVAVMTLVQFRYVERRVNYLD